MRVVVVVVGGEQFDDPLVDLLLSCSPTLNLLRGGIRGLFDQISLGGGICDSKTRFLFGVGSIHGLPSKFLFNPLLRKVVTIIQKIIYTLFWCSNIFLFSFIW